MTDQLDCLAPLFVPADRPERFSKAAKSGADAVILDLEDAVAPEAKASARNFLRVDFTSLPVIVRVNAIATPWHAHDLAAVRRLRPAAVMLPKTEERDSLGQVCSFLGEAVPVIALIETGRGLANCRTMASTPGVVRLAFGSIDFCADLGCAHTREALLAARSELVLASRLGERQAPLDGVTATIDNAALVSDDARHARGLGFGGKLCIHPRQIEHVLAGFRPDASEVAWANKVLASGSGAVVVDGAMVDGPVRLRAQAILRRSGIRTESA